MLVNEGIHERFHEVSSWKIHFFLSLKIKIFFLIYSD